MAQRYAGIPEPFLAPGCGPLDDGHQREAAAAVRADGSSYRAYWGSLPFWTYGNRSTQLLEEIQ